uniref:Uncharacterized protein n=1 Tax=Arundo donax TaxID=35708 RepID=A0A0A8ZZB4_ARUDO
MCVIEKIIELLQNKLCTYILSVR